MSDAAATIKSIKSVQPVREMFVSQLHLNSWEQARDSYPEYTSLKSLERFAGLGKPSDSFLV